MSTNLVDALDQALLKVAAGSMKPAQFVDAVADLVTAERQRETGGAQFPGDTGPATDWPKFAAEYLAVERGEGTFELTPNLDVVFKPVHNCEDFDGECWVDNPDCPRFRNSPDQ